MSELNQPAPGPVLQDITNVQAPEAVKSVDAQGHGFNLPEKYDYSAMEQNDGNNNGGGAWEGNATVYHWDGEEGDVGPEHPELEIELFGAPEDREAMGKDFSKYVY
jgi:ATP-dependent RNA helicase DDX3X